MGMFDYVRCEAKLPKPEPMDGLYQTKDTECNLDEYTITKYGQLFCARFDADAEPQLAEPAPSNFSGTMDFYGTTKQTGRWKEYHALFSNGIMLNVKHVWRGDD